MQDSPLLERKCVAHGPRVSNREPSLLPTKPMVLPSPQVLPGLLSRGSPLRLLQITLLTLSLQMASPPHPALVNTFTQVSWGRKGCFGDVVLILALTAQQVLDKPTLGLLNRRASGRHTVDISLTKTHDFFLQEIFEFSNNLKHMTIQSYLVKPLINCLDKEQNYIKFIYLRKSEGDPWPTHFPLISDEQESSPQQQPTIGNPTSSSISPSPNPFLPTWRNYVENYSFSGSWKNKQKKEHIFSQFLGISM